MTGPPWTALRTVDDALMGRMYFSDQLRLGPLYLAWNPLLREPEWRRIRILDDAPDLQEQLGEAMARLTGDGEGCSIEIDPQAPADLAGRLETWGFSPRFPHRWFLWDLPHPLTASGSVADDDGPDLGVRALEGDTVETFVALYHQGFTSDDGGHFGAPWDAVVRRMLAVEPTTTSDDGRPLHLHHVIAFLGDRAAGVASLGVLGDTAGLYNLAVPPRYRHRGVARLLMRERLRRAHQLGARVAYLQAEDESVDRWHRRTATHAGPVVNRWLAPSA